MSIHSVSLQEAEGHLADLIKLADQGQSVVITRDDAPEVELVIKASRSSGRIAGLHAGQGWISEDFDEPLGEAFWLGQDAP